MSDVFPLLQPADWPGVNTVAHTRIGHREAELVIAYARDIGNGYEMIDRTAPEAYDRRALHARALRNLGALQYKWELGSASGLTFATCSGHDFSAEKVLDPDAMRQAQWLLGTQEIIVAVPRRTCITVFPASAMDDINTCHSMMFTQYYAYTDDSYGNAPISPMMFVLRDGAHIGFVRTAVFFRYFQAALKVLGPER